ncbi:hypothetical protein BC829DRAFT_286993 [Chytridium lagenaria]|nr:hypothetical protein BC829DRAFT_286993 [Chytridium lagenaria]
MRGECQRFQTKVGLGRCRFRVALLGVLLDHTSLGLLLKEVLGSVEARIQRFCRKSFKSWIPSLNDLAVASRPPFSPSLPFFSPSSSPTRLSTSTVLPTHNPHLPYHRPRLPIHRNRRPPRRRSIHP